SVTKTLITGFPARSPIPTPVTLGRASSSASWRVFTSAIAISSIDLPSAAAGTGRGLFGRSSRPPAQTSTRNDGWESGPEFLLRGREAPQQRSRAPERAQDTPFVAFGYPLPHQGDP